MLVFNFIWNCFIAFPSVDQAAEESEETEDQAVPKGKMVHCLTLIEIFYEFYNDAKGERHQGSVLLLLLSDSEEMDLCDVFPPHGSVWHDSPRSSLVF